MEIRQANKEDVDLLYGWSNDKLVRQQSFNSAEISYESHCHWFNAKLKEEKYLIFIITLNNHPMAMVRFEVGDESALISVSIETAFRGKGHGSEIIKIGTQQYFKTHKIPVLAYVKKSNVGSVKSFIKAGYTHFKDVEVSNNQSFIYKIENE